MTAQVPRAHVPRTTNLSAFRARYSAVSRLAFAVVVKRIPLKPSIKFIFNGVIKAFYLSDRREL